MVERITRRRFLLGAGGTTLAVGVGGVAFAATHEHEVRRLLHSHGALGGPDAAVPSVDATVEYGEFESAAAKHRVGYGLYAPDEPARAVLYCLHGRGGSHRDPFIDLGVHKFVIAAGLPFAVASVDGGESFWHRRADGSDTQRLVLEELMPMVAGKVPGASPVVMGWSMGAYGALLMAEHHAGIFAGVVASSPSVWRTAQAAPPGAFDDLEDFTRNDVLTNAPALDGRITRIDCGRDDIFAGTTNELMQRAPGTAGGVRDGFHDSPTWRSFLPDQLSFLRSVLT